VRRAHPRAPPSFALTDLSTPRRREYAWEFVLPLAAALVPSVDAKRRLVRVLPPAGLLDAGDAERLLDWLRAELEPYLRRSKSDPTGTRCVARTARSAGLR